MRYGRNANWTFENTPFYEEPNPDTLMAGVVHRRFDGKVKFKQTKEFVRRINAKRNLMMEANEKIHRRSSKLKEGKTHEAVALSRHIGRKHFPEEGADHFDLLVSYGMPRGGVGLYQMLRSLEVLENNVRGYSRDAFEGGVRRGLKICTRIFPSFQKIDSEQTARQVSSLISAIIRSSDSVLKITQNRQRLDIVGDIFQFYLARVRDAEIFVPFLANHEFDGGMVAVVGVGHVGYQKQGVCDGRLDVPKWGEFVDDLKEEYRETIRHIESEIVK